MVTALPVLKSVERSNIGIANKSWYLCNGLKRRPHKKVFLLSESFKKTGERCFENRFFNIPIWRLLFLNFFPKRRKTRYYRWHTEHFTIGKCTSLNSNVGGLFIHSRMKWNLFMSSSTRLISHATETNVTICDVLGLIKTRQLFQNSWQPENIHAFDYL